VAFPREGKILYGGSLDGEYFDSPREVARVKGEGGKEKETKRGGGLGVSSPGCLISHAYSAEKGPDKKGEWTQELTWGHTSL